jgi:hypothetical protein
MRRVWVAAATTLARLLVLPGGTAQAGDRQRSPVVRTDKGQVRDVRDCGVDSFLGVRYAAVRRIGVVGVSFNYRLGVLGFGLAALRREAAVPARHRPQHPALRRVLRHRTPLRLLDAGTAAGSPGQVSRRLGRSCRRSRGRAVKWCGYPGSGPV